MILTPTQATVAGDRHRFRVLRCGRRWGKTTLSVEEIKGYLLYREARVAYLATTYQQARDIIWQTLKKELEPIAITVNESRLEIVVRNKVGGTSTLFLRGWESVETLRGQFFDFLVLDEVASMRHFWVLWQEVLRPTLTDRKGAAMFLGTPKGYNHFFELSNEELKYPDTWKSFHYTSFDNPHLDPEEIEAARLTMPSDRFGQEYLAQFHKAEGLVYPEFERGRNVAEVETKGWSKLGGLDFGYTNPAALLDVYTDGERFHVRDEWYKTGRTDAQIAEYAQQKAYEALYPDPENAAGVEELRRKNLNVREVIKGKGSVETGIQRVRELLLAGKLTVDPGCINVIAEFESYSYPEEVGDKNAREKPLKKGDHAMDALRYVVMMRVSPDRTPLYQQPAYRPDEFEGGIEALTPAFGYEQAAYEPGEYEG